MNSTTYITLDLQAPNLAVVVSAKQEDTRGRRIAATLRDGSASFDATGLLCEIRYAKPDGTVGFYDTLEDDVTPAYTIDGNVVTFTLAEQMLTVAGAVYVDLNFYAPTGEKLTAFAFVLQVEASVLSDGTIVSSDYYNVLTATLAEAAEIAANLPVPSTSTPIPDSASGSAGTGNGFARGNHSHPINVATSGTPANLGTAANGTSANYARQDHVHTMPSASDVGALPDTTTAADLGVEYKLFNSVADLGLTIGSASIADAYAAMPASSVLICPASEFTNPPNTDGTIEIAKGGTDGWIEFHGRLATVGDYRMFFTSSDVPSGTWSPVDPYYGTTVLRTFAVAISASECTAYAQMRNPNGVAPSSEQINITAFGLTGIVATGLTCTIDTTRTDEQTIAFSFQKSNAFTLHDCYNAIVTFTIS